MVQLMAPIITVKQVLAQLSTLFMHNFNVFSFVIYDQFIIKFHIL